FPVVGQSKAHESAYQEIAHPPQEECLGQGQAGTGQRQCPEKAQAKGSCEGHGFHKMTHMPTAPQVPPAPKLVKEPEWSPRMWHGCDFFAWIKLLARNRFRVHWSYLYIAVLVTFVTFGHTLFRWLQEAILGRRIRKTKITQP